MNWPYPLWIAHRGAGKLAPENTLAAFRQGASFGYRAFECDVKLSADGQLFLLHDATLDRTTDGRGVAGICLIRLRHIRPRFVPSRFGITSENAAHRIAVVWDGGGEGVFIPRRDTSSRLNSLAGGRLFPGVHHRSTFAVVERHPWYSIAIADQSETRMSDSSSESLSAIRSTWRKRGSDPNRATSPSIRRGASFAVW